MNITSSPIDGNVIDKLEDGSVVIMQINTTNLPEGMVWNDVAETCVSIMDHVRDQRGKNILVIPVPQGSTAEILRAQPSDILAIKMENVKFDESIARHSVNVLLRVVEAAGFKGRLGVVCINSSSGVESLMVLGDDNLANIGLIKIQRLVDAGFTTEELKRAGIELDDLPIIGDGDGSRTGAGETKVVKYILHPSGTIGVGDLVRLYGVELGECIDGSKMEGLRGINPDDFIHLYPRLDGKYILPTRKGK